jgi:hypothetical protein
MRVVWSRLCSLRLLHFAAALGRSFDDQLSTARDDSCGVRVPPPDS